MSVLQTFRKAIGNLYFRLRYNTQEGYDAPRYWRDRLGAYGRDLRGVGNSSFVHAENQRQYLEASTVFREYCSKEGVKFAEVEVIEVGCGTGFYCDLLRDAGVAVYTGLDVTDVLLPVLRERHPRFRFLQIDISQERVEYDADLVMMIDVTQHIVNEDAFRRAMTHVAEMVRPGGLVMMTSFLDQTTPHGPHERPRELSRYEAAFPQWSFRDPVRFRDKFLFGIRRPD